jgi:cysteinyl-tRNA synthetase
MIRLRNTLSGRLQPFEPIAAPVVGMYNCGPTVYSPVHIGNLRSYVFADTLRRTLEYKGYDVRQVVNITDVGHLTSDADIGEDKMEKAARERKLKTEDIVEEVSAGFFADLEKLNITSEGTVFPRASKHIPEQIELIQALEAKGSTYRTSDGIYFDTATFPGYGKLGKLDLSGIEEGARIGVNTEKRNPTDFALWKFSLVSPNGERREQEWESPWGIGFPGWHLECSAMSMKYLGETFDIHTGGIDHIPVHHQNEIAQSEAATGKPLARYWLHNAFITIDGRKISKSLGNTLTISDLESSGFSPLAYRYWLLTASYRQTANFTFEALEGASNALKRLHSLVRTLPAAAVSKEEADVGYLERFEERMYEDLDSPGAIAIMWELAKDSGVSPTAKKATLFEFDRFLGLGLSEEIKAVPEAVLALASKREAARANQDWNEADKFREEIEAAGFEIQDGEDGPVVFSR